MKTCITLCLILFSSLSFSQFKKKEIGCYKGMMQGFEIFQEDKHQENGTTISPADACLKITKDSCLLFLNRRVFSGTYSGIEQQKTSKKVILNFNDLGKFKVIIEGNEKQLIFFGREQQPSVILKKLKKKEACN